MNLNLHIETLTTSTIILFIQSKQWSESYGPKTRITRPQKNNKGSTHNFKSQEIQRGDWWTKTPPEPPFYHFFSLTTYHHLLRSWHQSSWAFRSSARAAAAEALSACPVIRRLECIISDVWNSASDSNPTLYHHLGYLQYKLCLICFPPISSCFFLNVLH